MNEIDEYLAPLPESQRKELERIRKITKDLVPEAEETISYGLPTLKYKGKYLIYFGAFKNHMSVFPGPKTDLVKEKLKDFKLAKGTIQFTEAKPIPEDIIKDLVLMRKAELDS